jgi:hypothetical protein
LAAWPSAAPLFVGADGERITRGTLQYRVLRAFRRAGTDADRALTSASQMVVPLVFTQPIYVTATKSTGYVGFWV